MNEESLFAAALEKQDAAERHAFLAEACGGDVAMRQRLEQLLAAHGQAAGILERGPEAAAIRAENSGNAEKQAPLNLQDAAGLVRLARISRDLDRAQLRPSGDTPEGQSPAAKGPRKVSSSGGHP